LPAEPLRYLPQIFANAISCRSHWIVTAAALDFPFFVNIQAVRGNRFEDRGE